MDEDRYLTLPPVEAALGAARAKAAAAAALAPGRAVLAADTVVATEEEALGKPATPERHGRPPAPAERPHIVVTALVLRRRGESARHRRPRS